LYCNWKVNYINLLISLFRHVISSDLTKCPNCHFPAITSEFKKILGNEQGVCMMCEERIDPYRLEKMEDVVPYLKSRKISRIDEVKVDEKNPNENEITSSNENPID